MKEESGTDSPPPSTGVSDFAAVAVATATYLGLLAVGSLALWGLLGAVDLVPRASPLTAAGEGRSAEVLRGALLFAGLAGWAWCCDLWLRRLWSRRRSTPLIALPLRGRALPLLLATLVGASSVVVGVWISGARSADVARLFDPGAWWLLCLFLLVAAALEEIALRGVLLALWVAALGRPAALFVTSVLFAWLHQSNPGASSLGLLNTLLAGWVLGELALRGRSLGAPIALHFAWNWAQGLLLGLPVSGQRASTSVLSLEPGDGALAGGAYGFEGGGAATLVLAVGVVWALWPGARSASGHGPGSEQSARPGDE